MMIYHRIIIVSMIEIFLNLLNFINIYIYIYSGKESRVSFESRGEIMQGTSKQLDGNTK